MATQKSVWSFSQRIVSFILWIILGFFLGVGLSLQHPANSLEPRPIEPSIDHFSSSPHLVDSLKSEFSISQLEQQGREFYEAGQFEKAVQVWQEIITRETDQLRQAAALGNLSLSLQKLGEWQAADQAIRESLKLLDNLSTPQDKNILTAQAQALSIQGNLYFSRGNYSQALEIWQRVENIDRQIQNENHRIQTLLNQAQALQGLGLYRRAEKTLIEISQSLQAQPNSSLKFSHLLHLSNVLRVSGNLGNIEDLDSNICELVDQATLQGSDQSELSATTTLLNLIQTVKQLKSPQLIGETQLSIANLARAVYQQQTELDNLNLIQKSAQMALDCYQQAANTSAPDTQIKARLNSLSLLLELNQKLNPEKDNKLGSQVQSKLNLEQTKWQEIISKINILPFGRMAIYGKIDLVQSLMQLAVHQPTLYQQIEPILFTALEQAKQLGDPRVESYVLGYLGQLYEQQTQWQKAKNYTQNALLLSQSIQADEMSYKWQWQLGRILKQQNNSDPKNAIAAYTGAVQTLQSLRQDLVAIRQDIQFDFRDRVEPVYRELVDLLLSAENPSADNLKQARDVIENLQLAELDNFFRDACIEAQPQAIDQIDPNAVILYGIILKDRLEMIASLPDNSLFHYRTSIANSELTQSLKQLRFFLQKPYLSPEAQQLSQQVYRWLIEPLDSQLKGNETLVFVLDGELRNIPMAALSDGKQYLIEKHPVVIAPGLQLLDPKPITRPLNALTAGLVEPPKEWEKQFAILPNVPEELQKIEEVGVNSEALLNEEFNRENLETQVTSQPFQVIHLATHGQFSSQAEKTFILAADGPINIKQLDNLFRSREQNQTRAIDLLVLSACETAPGDNRAVLGLAGIAVRAGARSTVASLWSLNDESAVAFMGHFYKQLVEGKTRAEALRQAQLAFLKDKNRYDAPVYWAPYVLVGNWR
jgi:CHAT domain-containing protein